MKKALSLVIMSLSILSVTQAFGVTLDSTQLGEEALSRLISIFGMVSSAGEPKVLVGKTPTGELCNIVVSNIETDETSSVQIGGADITIVTHVNTVNFRTMSGQIRGPGASPNGVDIQSTHQDGMFSNELITQHLVVTAPLTVGDQAKNITVTITDGSRGTATCSL